MACFNIHERAEKKNTSSIDQACIPALYDDDDDFLFPRLIDKIQIQGVWHNRVAENSWLVASIIQISVKWSESFQ